jgi:hypothetical protein
MHIDRTRFLLLASAIAACAPRKGGEAPAQTIADPDAGAPPVATAAPPPKSDEGVVGTPWSANEGKPPVYEGGGGWTPPPNGEGYYPPPNKEGYPSPNAEGGPGPTLKGMGVPVASWTCSGSDDVGKAPYCAIKVPKSCAPFPFVHQSCNGARKYFKPKIAERAVTCMHKLTPNAVCSAMTYECRDAAMRSACPDAQADMECQALSKKCPKMSMTECRMYMNGLNAMGRAEIIKCISTPSGCGFGVYSCTEGLNDP